MGKLTLDTSFEGAIVMAQEDAMFEAKWRRFRATVQLGRLFGNPGGCVVCFEAWRMATSRYKVILSPRSGG